MKSRVNPAVDRINAYNAGHDAGLESGFVGAMLLTLLSLKNVNDEGEYIKDERYAAFVQDLEEETGRIFREHYGNDPKNLIYIQQHEVKDRAESVMWYVEKERERLGLEPLRTEGEK